MCPLFENLDGRRGGAVCSSLALVGYWDGLKGSKVSTIVGGAGQLTMYIGNKWAKILVS